jgi:S1-C subfamily serine protease
MRLAGAVLIVLAGIWTAFAQGVGERPSSDQRLPAAKKAAPAPKATRAKKPAKEAPNKDYSRIRESYAAISEADRRAIQFDLVWIGDYAGPVSAEINDRVIDAVKSFQRNHKAKETGVLNPQERGALAAAAKVQQEEVGWRIIDDPVTGVRLGLPTKQVPQSGTGKAGSRWSSAHGQVQVETFRIAAPGTTLPAVFEQQKNDPVQRRVETSVLRPDFFILTGLQGLKKFHVRAHIQGSEVRGITVLYDQFNEGIMDPVAIAMLSVFAPFASGTVKSTPALKRKVEYGTGIIVSGAGHIVTDRQVIDGCQFVTIAGLGSAEVVAEDTTSDLALIRLYGASNLMPIPFAGESSKGNNVTLVGITDPQAQAGGNAITTVFARLGGPPDAATRSIEPVPGLGFSGAAAIDGQGRLVGMVELKASAAIVVPGASIRTFLEAHNIHPSGGSPGGREVKDAVVRVICVRK